MIGFVFFLFLPVAILKSKTKKVSFHNIFYQRDISFLINRLSAGENVKHRIQRLSGATSLSMLKTGNDNFFELKFKSFRDSLNFKKAVILSGKCPHSKITIIEDNHEYLVIFLASANKVVR